MKQNQGTCYLSLLCYKMFKYQLGYVESFINLTPIFAINGLFDNLYVTLKHVI